MRWDDTFCKIIVAGSCSWPKFQNDWLTATYLVTLRAFWTEALKSNWESAGKSVSGKTDLTNHLSCSCSHINSGTFAPSEMLSPVCVSINLNSCCLCHSLVYGPFAHRIPNVQHRFPTMWEVVHQPQSLCTKNAIIVSTPNEQKRN
jgi:hypothetical protein